MTRKTNKARETVRDNPAYAAARPVLSVLVPFLRDDPLPLLEALDREADIVEGAVEIVLLDDGSADSGLAERVDAGVERLKLAVRVVRLAQNEGRARGRNRLAAHARADVFLFLDADMHPDNRRFLQAWLDVVALDDPAVAFGGFSLKHASRESAFAVHRAMAQKAECVPWFERARTPEKYVYTSNLLVRRDAFEAEAFDRDFAGWGWEDVEWGMRVARRFSVRHVDIPATHLGLDTVEALAAKYEQSVSNFARVVSRHPEVVRSYPSYRAAQLLKKAPALPAWRPLLKRAALISLLPAQARAFSLRLYRAALYAEAV